MDFYGQNSRRGCRFVCMAVGRPLIYRLRAPRSGLGLRAMTSSTGYQ